MQENKDNSVDQNIDIQSFFDCPPPLEYQQILKSTTFERVSWRLDNIGEVIHDRFPDIDGASCSFFRLSSREVTVIRFIVSGEYQVVKCPSGGWLLKAADDSAPSYWLPETPILRSVDPFGRILSEKPISISEFKASVIDLYVGIKVSNNMYLDMTLWCFQPGCVNIIEELERPLVLEKQSVYFWTSETTYQEPADLYLYLVHGHVYTNRFIWPRKWKICSELDAYGLYVTLNGLELATDKVLYDLLKRQILLSVIVRQAEDGGWYHGEWTKYMESHYRLHNGAMLLLEASLQERPDEVVSKALRRAAHFVAQKTDDIDLGLWFMHDSLEDSTEMMEEMCRVNKSNWVQLPVLGKTATNKLIFNTHVDTLISLELYRNVTGDNQYAEQIDSALQATLGMLALRPAETVYRFIYQAIKLTLLPETEAQKLPIIMRALKRITWTYITPNLFRIKNIYPRLVMPGGYIERHLGMGHYDINYHPINVMDLARLWRCFPDADLAQTIDEAVKAVSNSSMLEYWAEKEPRHKSLVEWADALYHLCTIKDDFFYRQLLAEGMIIIEDRGIGLPPALLGGDREAIGIAQKVATPSPIDSRIRIANLSCGDQVEILVVNPSVDNLELVFEENKQDMFSWMQADGHLVSSDGAQLRIPPKSCLLGKKSNKSGNYSA